MKIIFVCADDAYYPSIDACKVYFGVLGIEVRRSRFDQINFDLDYADTIFWQIMGFNRKRMPRPNAGIIHEYRSGSVGVLGRAKDIMKKHFTPKPDLRLFQTDHLRRKFNPQDSVPYGILGLGVPDSLTPTVDQGEQRYDFGYVGQISNERKIPQLLRSFLKKYGSSRSICMIGSVRDGIERDFAVHTNISFLGRLDQNDAFAIIKNCTVGLAYFPYHYPHKYQPPTKLYEYATMGMRILANDSPGNLEAMSELGISALVMKGLSFPPFDSILKQKDNINFDPKKLRWSGIIETSGVLDFIKRSKR